MKLHTDFHDYYDNAVGYGIDEKVHYNRFMKEVEIRIKPHSDIPRFLEAYLLGFCGKVYPMVAFHKFHERENDYEDDKIIQPFFAYSFNDAKEKSVEWDNFRHDISFYDREELQVKQFFTDWKFQSNEVFIEHKCPVWLLKLGENAGLINPKLKDYGFDRIKDSFTAFQEISMYLSNILVEQKEIVKIEDKYRIEQHGFDLKTSFRKEKNK